MARELTVDVTVDFPGGTSVSPRLTVPLEDATVTVLFGPSGSGKSTVLRAISGLARPGAGTIVADGEAWFDAARGVHWPPQRRRVGVLLQEPTLFPHLSVAGNVGYGVSGLPREERRRRVGDLLSLFGLEGLGGRRPDELSGGQRQRAALARTVAPRPRLLLLDEPLSSLDGPAREELREELKRLLRRVGTPAVLVTHDRTEALALGDRLTVIDGGRVLQQGAAPDVFLRPCDALVAKIVGVESVLSGRVAGREGGLLSIDVSGVRLWAVDDGRPHGDVFCCLRAEDVVLERGDVPLTSARNRLAGTVTEVLPEGPLSRVLVDCGVPLAARVTLRSVAELGLAAGVSVTAVFKAPSVHLVARDV